ncbi:MAG: GNAT family N-acetyltransferase, partial [Omnitrophica WOR_2 bacterium]
DEPTTKKGLIEEYETKRNRIIQKVAEDEKGELVGFYWVVREKVITDRMQLYLFVKPEQRRQGIGFCMYEDVMRALEETQAKCLRVSIQDTCPECRSFAGRCGFTEKLHRIGMALDLDAFNDHPYGEIITRLTGEGFQFTSLQELGNTEEAQHKLYVLNDTAASTTPGSDDEHPWGSFEDFQKSVCQSEWYKPDGQMVVVDTASGAWAAMSAITRFEGSTYAYNLFTGVDMPYRGRKLAQAVKVQALRYARDVLKVHEVRTHHNAMNHPMIAIDRKLGYHQIRGIYLMEKMLV